MAELWFWFKWQVNRFFPACPKCAHGRIHYLGEDYTGRIWMSIYQCDQCGEEYI